MSVVVFSFVALVNWNRGEKHLISKRTLTFLKGALGSEASQICVCGRNKDQRVGTIKLSAQIPSITSQSKRKHSSQKIGDTGTKTSKYCKTKNKFLPIFLFFIVFCFKQTFTVLRWSFGQSLVLLHVHNLSGWLNCNFLGKQSIAMMRMRMTRLLAVETHWRCCEWWIGVITGGV